MRTSNSMFSLQGGVASDERPELFVVLYHTVRADDARWPPYKLLKPKPVSSSVSSAPLSSLIIVMTVYV
jgi:hypothetical protein